MNFPAESVKLKRRLQRLSRPIRPVPKRKNAAGAETGKLGDGESPGAPGPDDSLAHQPMAVVLLSMGWWATIQLAQAQSDDVNDNGNPDVWMDQWKLPGSVPHDVTEGDDLTFTVKRDGTDTSDPATMALRWEKRPGSPDVTNMINSSGTENPRPNSITIPAGQTEATLSWSTTDDDEWERDIWLFVCINSAPSGYQFHDDRFGPDRNCTGWRIGDDDPAPLITPKLKDDQAFSVTEGDSVNLQLTRTLPAGKSSPHMEGELTVHVKLKEQFRETDGTFTVRVVDPADRTNRGHPVTFSAGENTADFTYTPADNNINNPERVLALQVEADRTTSSTKRARWDLTAHNEVWFRIKDDEYPVITIAADEATVGEEDGAATFTLTRDGDTSTPLTVNVALTQTGDYLQEYHPLVQPVIPEGSTDTTVSLPLDDDDLREEDGSITVEIIDLPQYDLGGEYTARSSITSDDAQQHVYVEPRLRGTHGGRLDPLLEEVEEGEDAPFRIRRRELNGDNLTSDNIPARGELEVNLHIAQEGKFRDGNRVLAWTPDENRDWQSTELTTDADGLVTVTIPAAQADIWVTVPTIDDRRLWTRDGQAFRDIGGFLDQLWQPAYELHGAVTLEVREGDNYTPGRQDGTDASGRIKVLDNEPPFVTISRSENTQAHGYGVRDPKPNEGTDWIIWVNRYLDETDDPLDVRLKISVLPDKCIDTHTLGTSAGRLILEGEEPFLDEHLGEMTATIPAGAGYVAVSIPVIDDDVTECSPKVKAEILRPQNAETLRAADQRNHYSLTDFLQWDYHSLQNPGQLFYDRDWESSTATAPGASIEERINDDDPYPEITFTAANAQEGEDNAEVRVTLSHNNHRWDYTLEWWTQDGTATAGEDYTASSGTVVLPADIGNPDSIHRDLIIPITDDRLHEPGDDETFTIGYTISTPIQEGLEDAIRLAIGQTIPPTATIKDNDPKPDVRISNATGPEGDVDMHFLVDLSNPTEDPVTVDWTTRALTGDDAATAGTDYTTASGTLTFSTGQHRKEIPVRLGSDDTVEEDEKFEVILSNPVNAGCATLAGEELCTATGTIQDNSPDPEITPEGPEVTLLENAGNAVFRITLMHPDTGNVTHSNSVVTVDYETSDGSGVDEDKAATAGEDYTETKGKLTIPVGATTATISVPILDDERSDFPVEHLRLTLTDPTNAVLKAPPNEDTTEEEDVTDDPPDSISATAGIQDNDPLPEISVSDASVTEPLDGGEDAQMTFTLTLDRPSDRNARVRVATQDGTAKAG